MLEINDQRVLAQGFAPDIYVIALQEMVKLNTKNCLFKDKKKVDCWGEILSDALKFVNDRATALIHPNITDDELFQE
jgi:hypothetical protein